MTINSENFKEKLTEELSKLESELSTVGRKNPDNPKDWEPTEAEDIDPAEDAEIANSIETFENNRGVLNQLEIRLNEVKDALTKIDSGTYGKCDVCGNDIEEDRLEANPAARTCKSHMNG